MAVAVRETPDHTLWALQQIAIAGRLNRNPGQSRPPGESGTLGKLELPRGPDISRLEGS